MTKKLWKDKWERKAWNWTAKRGIAFLAKDLAKLLRKVHDDATDKSLLEGMRVGGRVAISAMRGTQPKKEAGE